jgi:hypothetical protein
LKDTAPDDFAVILAGLNKLKLREYHRPPLSKPIGDGLRFRGNLTGKRDI